MVLGISAVDRSNSGLTSEPGPPGACCQNPEVHSLHGQLSGLNTGIINELGPYTVRGLNVNSDFDAMQSENLLAPTPVDRGDGATLEIGPVGRIDPPGSRPGFSSAFRRCFG